MIAKLEKERVAAEKKAKSDALRARFEKKRGMVGVGVKLAVTVTAGTTVWFWDNGCQLVCYALGTV